MFTSGKVTSLSGRAGTKFLWVLLQVKYCQMMLDSFVSNLQILLAFFPGSMLHIYLQIYRLIIDALGNNFRNIFTNAATQQRTRGPLIGRAMTHTLIATVFVPIRGWENYIQYDQHLASYVQKDSACLALKIKVIVVAYFFLFLVLLFLFIEVPMSKVWPHPTSFVFRSHPTKFQFISDIISCPSKSHF